MHQTRFFLLLLTLVLGVVLVNALTPQEIFTYVDDCDGGGDLDPTFCTSVTAEAWQQLLAEAAENADAEVIEESDEEADSDSDESGNNVVAVEVGVNAEGQVTEARRHRRRGHWFKQRQAEARRRKLEAQQAEEAAAEAEHEQNHREADEADEAEARQRELESNADEGGPVRRAGLPYPKGIINLAFVETAKDEYVTGTSGTKKAVTVPSTTSAKFIADAAHWWEERTCLDFRTVKQTDAVDAKVFVSGPIKPEGQCSSFSKPYGYTQNKNAFIWGSGVAPKPVWKLTAKTQAFKLTVKVGATSKTLTDALAADADANTIQSAINGLFDTFSVVVTAFTDNSIPVPKTWVITGNAIPSDEVLLTVADGDATRDVTQASTGWKRKKGCPEGTMAHEEGHIMGLFHTHQRKDATTYFTIVAPVGNKASQYTIDDNTQLTYPEIPDMAKGEYDFRLQLASSIMMYKTGITVKDFQNRDNTAGDKATLQSKLMSRDKLADLDVSVVNRYYTCIPLSMQLDGKTDVLYVHPDRDASAVRDRAVRKFGDDTSKKEAWFFQMVANCQQSIDIGSVTTDFTVTRNSVDVPVKYSSIPNQMELNLEFAFKEKSVTVQAVYDSTTSKYVITFQGADGGQACKTLVKKTDGITVATIKDGGGDGVYAYTAATAIKSLATTPLTQYSEYHAKFEVNTQKISIDYNSKKTPLYINPNWTVNDLIAFASDAVGGAPVFVSFTPKDGTKVVKADSGTAKISTKGVSDGIEVAFATS